MQILLQHQVLVVFPLYINQIHLFYGIAFSFHTQLADTYYTSDCGMLCTCGEMGEAVCESSSCLDNTGFCAEEDRVFGCQCIGGYEGDGVTQCNSIGKCHWPKFLKADYITLVRD